MSSSPATGHLYLIPCFLHEEGISAIPSYVREITAKCSVFFVENERSARRYLKKLWKEIVIDDYTWQLIEDAGAKQVNTLLKALQEGKHVGIISEAGCPGIADPGQLLVKAAQEKNYKVIPLVGPSSILLALMASGMNGQQFSFHGYLPIDGVERKKKIRELESVSAQSKATQIFIETPYRNQALLQDIIHTCRQETLLCVAADLTGPDETVVTRPIGVWKKTDYAYHKRPAIFLLSAG